jgi:hypothetical protein
MPLLDHFYPPLSVERPWEGFHCAWASTIATRLNEEQLPPDYFAMPMVTVGGRVEVDVAAFQSGAAAGPANGALATAVWAPPRPALTAAADFLEPDAFEVQVFKELGGPKLRAAIELVSPANKDRPGHRQAFAVKCAAHLQRGVSVIVVDIVTERAANLHAELAQVLGLADALAWQAPSGLYAVTYRPARGEVGGRIDVWAEALAAGEALPTLPLWLDEDLCLPLRLEESYKATCTSLRIRP